MDGVVLIRFFDGWMDLYGSGWVWCTEGRGLIFSFVFLYRFLSLLDRFWDRFWDPKLVPKSVFWVYFLGMLFFTIFYRFFIDFSSPNRPWNAYPHESPKKHRNWTENSCFLRLRRNFWPSGSISSIFFGSKKSLFCRPKKSRKQIIAKGSPKGLRLTSTRELTD